MAAFALALARVQNDGDHLLLPARLDQLARTRGHEFRNTLLTPGNTLALFARQIAHGNVACAAMHHLADADFSDAAWCQARSRLPIDLIDAVDRRIVDEARRDLDHCDDLGEGSHRWRGHRLCCVDGTSDSMPDTPELRAHYGVPSGVRPGLGFPTSHLMLLMDHRSGLILDCIDSPMNTHDASVVSQTHGHLAENDIVLGDVAFSSYAHLALLSQAKVHAILPTHQQRLVDFTPGRTHADPRRGKSRARAGKPRSRLVRPLGKDDQLVDYLKPANKPAWMDARQWEALPDSIPVREIRRTVSRAGFRPIEVSIVTTLLDAEAYPADELIELRLSRWMMELNIRHLKTTLGMDVLKCKTIDGIRKERRMFLLVYNLIRVVMLRAARCQRVNVNRLSFADTLAWLRLGDTRGLHEGTLRLKVNPLRPGRLEPRALKRQQMRFPYMTRPRSELKAQLRARHAVVT